VIKYPNPLRLYDDKFRALAIKDQKVSDTMDRLKAFHDDSDYWLLLCGYYQVSPFGMDFQVANKMKIYASVLRSQDEVTIEERFNVVFEKEYWNFR
jgi:hypothetical protein